MWRLWHALFGWEYVYFIMDDKLYLRRVIRPNTRLPYIRVWGKEITLAYMPKWYNLTWLT